MRAQAARGPLASIGSLSPGELSWLDNDTARSSAAPSAKLCVTKFHTGVLCAVETLNLWGRYPASADVPLLCCMPAYSEEGYTFTRSIQALALQVADWNQDGRRRQAHVFCVLDGMANVDKSMFQALAEFYKVAPQPAPEGQEGGKTAGEVLHEVIDQAFNPPKPKVTPADVVTAAVDEGVGGAGSMPARRTASAPSASYVMLQWGIPAASTLQVAPVSIDCSSAMLSDAREGADLAPLPTLPVSTRRWAKLRSKGHISEDSWASRESQCNFDIYVTVLIKKVNKRKHDSHRLFFEEFVPLQREFLHNSPPQFIFCTDVGTLYGPNMVQKLTSYLEHHPNVAACCAHQRIMSYADQANPAVSEPERPSAATLRGVQAFDFESGLAVFNGLHGLLGFLPVIPGPCGMFRVSAIYKNAPNDYGTGAAGASQNTLDVVRRICTGPPERDSLIQGNLKIAEDRILSYLLLLTGEGWETHWVPNVLFFFESEDALDEFVPQRRRWLNGTVAGYLWLITNPALWRAVFHTSTWSARWMSIKVFFVSLLQLCIFAMVYIMPAFIGLTGHLAIQGVDTLLRIWGFQTSPAATLAVVIVFWLLYGCSFIALTVHGRWFRTYGLALNDKQQPKGVWNQLWNLRVVLNAFIMLLNTSVLIGLVISSFVDADTGQFMDAENQALVRFVFALAVFYTLSPFYLSLMHSWRSFSCMAGAFPSYFLFLPTILSDFFAFSVANFDNWSWGTKESKLGSSSHSSGTDTARAKRVTSTRHAWSTTLLFGFQLFLNVTIVVASLAIQARMRAYFLVVGGFMSVVGLSLMLSSFLFFLGRTYLKSGWKLWSRFLLIGVVLSSWLGGLSLLAIFAPTPLTNTGVQELDENSYGYCFLCIGVLLVFVLCRKASYAWRNIRANNAAAEQALNDVQAALPSAGVASEEDMEIARLVADAVEDRGGAMDSCTYLFVILAGTCFLAVSSVIVFAMAFAVSIYHSLQWLFSPCCRMRCGCNCRSLTARNGNAALRQPLVARTAPGV